MHSTFSHIKNLKVYFMECLVGFEKANWMSPVPSSPKVARGLKAGLLAVIQAMNLCAKKEK